jgi:hypothetical protein
LRPKARPEPNSAAPLVSFADHTSVENAVADSVSHIASETRPMPLRRPSKYSGQMSKLFIIELCSDYQNHLKDSTQRKMLRKLGVQLTLSEIYWELSNIKASLPDGNKYDSSN